MKNVLDKKTILKSIGYRLFSTTITWIIAWIVTGDFYLGLTVGLFDVVIKIFTYYFFEKVWNKLFN